MGADLIGSFFFHPQEPTKNELKICQEHIEKLKEFTAKFPVEKFIKEYQKEVLIPEIKDFLESMPDFTYHLQEEIGDTSEEDIETAYENLTDTFIPLAEKFVKSKFKIICGRDLAMCTVTILGRPISVYFAGEMSWGDAPEGQGYETLMNLYRSGLGDVLNNLCFPSSASVHYIQNAE